MEPGSRTWKGSGWGSPALPSGDALGDTSETRCTLCECLPVESFLPFFLKKKNVRHPVLKAYINWKWLSHCGSDAQVKKRDNMISSGSSGVNGSFSTGGFRCLGHEAAFSIRHFFFLI